MEEAAGKKEMEAGRRKREYWGGVVALQRKTISSVLVTGAKTVQSQH